MSAQVQQVARLANLLRELPSAVGETVLANAGHLLPTQGSSAQREIEEQSPFVRRSRHPVLDTFSLVHVRLLGAMQNLVGIGYLLEGGPLEPACGVLARASLESAAVAWWLLGDEGDSRVRVVRGRAQQFHELQKDIDILRGVGSDAEGIWLTQQIGDTIDEIASDCEAVGIGVDRSARGYVSLPEAEVPSASRASKDFLGDDGLLCYRILCGSTHGSSQAALRSMTRAPLASRAEGVSVVMPANDPLSLIPTLGVVVQAYYRACDRRFDALGLGARPLAVWKSRIMPIVIDLLRSRDS